MKKMTEVMFLFITLFIFTMYTTEGRSQTHLDKIVAVVNSEIITQSQLEKAEAELKSQYERKNTPLPPAKQFRKEVLDHLINKNLQFQLAKAKNIEITEEDLNNALGNIAKQNNMDMEKLKHAVTQSGLDFNEFKKHIKEQLTLQKLQQSEVARTVIIDDAEVNEFIAKNKQMNQYNSFHLSDIVIPIPDNPTPEQIKNAQNKANTLIAQLRQGQTLSDATDLGWRTLPEIPPLFASKIQTLKIGAISEPIKAPNGFHILKLLDARGDGFKLTKKEAQNLIFQKKMGEAVKKWLEELRSTAYIKIM